MRKVIFLIIFLLALSVVMADNPPSLSNHQFFGDVTWEGTTPKEVVAKIGTTEFKSTVKINGPCVSGQVCKGTYGSDNDNILRVQGKSGDTVEFYVSDKKITSTAYKVSGVTRVDLDTTKKEEVKKETTKTTKKKTTTKTDSVKNTTTTSKTTETTTTTPTKDTTSSFPSSSGPGYTPPTSLPDTYVPPTETCSDGIKNQDEEDVDCGGVCDECGSSPLMWYVGGSVLLIIVLVLVWFFFFRGKSEVKEQVQSIFAQGRARGMSDEQISQGMQQKGWDAKTIEKNK